MEPLTKLTSRVVPLAAENVDTDQITPARFLKTTEKTGLGKILFYDWRYDESGTPRQEFVLNKPEYRGARILLAGNNFGCGSSREHAPWALADFGFRALISTSFADIFRNNCLKNGILPVVLEKSVHQHLFNLAEADPKTEVAIVLESQTLLFPDGRIVDFPIDPYSKKCLLRGLDDLAYLAAFLPQIEEFERRRTTLSGL